jgi:hypothetical protein
MRRVLHFRKQREIFISFQHVSALASQSDITLKRKLISQADVAPVNYYLHNLISPVDISLNDTLITPSENTYTHKAYLEATLNNGDKAKRGHLTAALFHKDSPSAIDDTQGDANNGLKIR